MDEYDNEYFYKSLLRHMFMLDGSFTDNCLFGQVRKVVQISLFGENKQYTQCIQYSLKNGTLFEQH